MLYSALQSKLLHALSYPTHHAIRHSALPITLFRTLPYSTLYSTHYPFPHPALPITLHHNLPYLLTYPRPCPTQYPTPHQQALAMPCPCSSSGEGCTMERKKRESWQCHTAQTLPGGGCCSPDKSPERHKNLSPRDMLMPDRNVIGKQLSIPSVNFLLYLISSLIYFLGILLKAYQMKYMQNNSHHRTPHSDSRIIEHATLSCN